MIVLVDRMIAMDKGARARSEDKVIRCCNITVLTVILQPDQRIIPKE